MCLVRSGCEEEKRELWMCTYADVKYAIIRRQAFVQDDLQEEWGQAGRQAETMSLNGSRRWLA